MKTSEISVISDRPNAQRVRALLVGIVVLSVTLRLIALGSDPFPWLDWDTGLMTDEGFYTHNARNIALFGHPRTDGFNNMLLSPFVHWVHAAVFSGLGVGWAQARSVSVILGLATIILLTIALRRAFGSPAALLAGCLLAFDHTNILYHRMALLDVPAAFLATLSFLVFVLAIRSDQPVAKNRWLFTCGLLIAATCATRTLCFYLVPAPFVGLLVSARKAPGKQLAILGAGLITGLALYGLFWCSPHWTELSHMSHYYRTAQIQPRSAGEFFKNVARFFVGGEYGTCAYLAMHTPVQLVLAVAGIGRRATSAGRSDRSGQKDDVMGGARAYICAWLLGCWLALSVSSYSPARYLVSSFPAMAALAALGAIAIGERLPHARRIRLLVMVTSVWFTVNIAWLALWLGTLSYTLSDASHWLSSSLPANSILIGDVAPGISLQTPFKAVNVQDGLCNDQNPIERFARAPRFIVILSDLNREKFWIKNYPYLIRKERQIRELRVMRWRVGIYHGVD